ncbi:MAG: PHP domain-containing protein [Anaeromicrobium sp.]|uniref:PHP domain-containing protein n=1 Tax=Anaeromicrobium sp. TaxID=1929132 RepID=UPI0025D2BAB2|nr:PHP domain-containing protein [Anaeromicrobium sp.]MCT4593723.1 PHP domain-containing protein [Anaeromicrobium sp.]
MKLIGDYHTHTIYSHGKGTIEDNVNVAIGRGLKEIAITDHGYGHFLYGIKKSRIAEMKEKIRNINEKQDKIKVKFGIECNILGFDGRLDVEREILDNIDIVLAGYHFGALSNKFIHDSIIHGRNFLGKYLTHMDKKNKIINTDTVIKAMYNYNIDILTHPGDKGCVYMKEVAKAAAETNTLLEINSSHSYLRVEDIKIAMEEGAMFVINSDAHRPEHVGVVERGIKRAIEAKLPIDRIVNME